MADLARVGLFLLALGATVASSLLWVSPLRLGGAAGLLAVWIVGFGQVILLAEGLSLLGALDWPGFLVGHLVILGCTVAWARRRPPAERWRAWAEIRSGLWRVAAGAWDIRLPALPLLVGTMLAVGLIGAIVALAVPPNNWDALAYHMPRVGYYLQFRSLDHYPTDDWRQVVFPANAEIAILWSVAFLRSDRLANAVQLVAWFCAAVAIYGLGRRLGLGLPGALLGAGAFALLPQPVRQSTNAQNDLLVAAFLAACPLFLLQAARSPRPIAPLTLAGAAVGLALGTKWTALLALPGLAVVLLLLFRRRPGRPVLTGFLLGGAAAVLLGSYSYVQNWLLYGSPLVRGFGTATSFEARPPTGVASPAGFWPTAALQLPIRLKSEALVPNLARTLFQGAFADLSGPLSDPLAQPVTIPLSRALVAGGEWLFATLGIPTLVERADLAYEPRFTFAYVPASPDAAVGVGLVGGLILAAALTVLIWPRRMPSGRRPLALAALSYLILLSLTLAWSPWGSPRYLLPACALAAPLLGLAIRWQARWGRIVALVLVAWSAATGLYVARVGESKSLPRLVAQDRLGLMMFYRPSHQRFFREVEQELGPTDTVGVYGDDGLRRSGFKDQWEYPFFGARFSRTVLPLVRTDYIGRRRLLRPPPWSNADLLEAYRPDYIAMESAVPAAEALPELVPARCFEVPLLDEAPMGAWRLWRCRDEDPRDVLENGDFRVWPDPIPGPSALPTGWEVERAGEGRLTVGRFEAQAGAEPFRLRLDYRGGGAGDRGGIVQEVPAGGLRGAEVVVDARVQADRSRAALLWVDDGEAVTEVRNATSEAETLRVAHRVAPRATVLRVGLAARAADRDAAVLVRAILAIPR